MGTLEAKDTLGPDRVSMDESTGSTSIMEKTEPSAPDADDEKNDVPDEPVVVKTEVVLDRTVSNLSQEPEEYPGTVKLMLVTLALCLSVFCMALVSSYASCSPSMLGVANSEAG